MMLPDVNVYLNALRRDLPEHQAAQAWFRKRLGEGLLTACWPPLLVGCIRIATNQRSFANPTSQEDAATFARQIVTAPATVMISPGERFWGIFTNYLIQTGAAGDHVTDASIAAIAVEHACEVATYDKDFARYKGLRWSAPKA